MCKAFRLPRPTDRPARTAQADEPVRVATGPRPTFTFEPGPGVVELTTGRAHWYTAGYLFVEGIGEPWTAAGAMLAADRRMCGFRPADPPQPRPAPKKRARRK